MHFAVTAWRQLTLSFPGESPQSSVHLLRLRSTGPGAFEGVLPALPISTQMLGCNPQPHRSALPWIAAARAAVISR